MASRAIALRAATWTIVVCCLPGLARADDDDRRRPDRPQILAARNDSGVAVTISSNGFIDRRNPFFRELGTNGRSCVSCHQPKRAGRSRPQGLRERVRRRPRAPIRSSASTTAPTRRSPTSRRGARARRPTACCSARALIRVGIGIPAGAEFELVAVDDPYGFASAAELSLFRRPLPTTNLRFLSTVMWDGRETFRDATSSDCLFGTTTCFAPLGIRPRRPVEQRDPRPRAGHGTADADAAHRDRRLRARPVHRPAAWTTRAGRLIGRTAPTAGRHSCPAVVFVLRHQRHAGRRLPQPRRLHADGDDALSGLAVVPRGRSPCRSRAARPRRRGRAARHRARPGARSTASRSPSAASRASTTTCGLPAIAGHLHHLPQHAERRQPLGPAAARHRLADACAPHARPAALHAAQQGHRRDRADDRSGPRPRSPASGTTSAASRARSCARWRRARRTSTTARRRTSTTWSASTTTASASGSPTRNATTSSPS